LNLTDAFLNAIFKTSNHPGTVRSNWGFRLYLKSSVRCCLEDQKVNFARFPDHIWFDLKAWQFSQHGFRVAEKSRFHISRNYFVKFTLVYAVQGIEHVSSVSEQPGEVWADKYSVVREKCQRWEKAFTTVARSYQLGPEVQAENKKQFIEYVAVGSGCAAEKMSNIAFRPEDAYEYRMLSRQSR
jgi:hypothetical protein